MSQTTEDWIWLARIRRAQGRKGEVLAQILTDYPERFSERKKLWLLPSNPSASAATRAEAPLREVELASHWLHKGDIVLHFSGFDSISAAETLAGLIVAVPRAQRVALPEDAVHIADLIGCSVYDISGEVPVPVGAIENVDRSAGPVPLLMVRGPKGELLIPFARSYLRKLDVEARRIEMALPEGLVDLNS